MFRLSFQQQVLTGFAISIIMVFAINYLAFTSIMNLTGKAKMVSHTQAVINKGNEVYQLLLNAETGQRGYVITGNEQYLDPYNTGLSNFEDAMQRLSLLIIDNPKQLATLDSVRISAEAKVEEMGIVIRLRREKGFEEAKARVLTNRGKQLMMNIRTHIKALTEEELRLLETREAESQDSVTQTYFVIIGGFVIVLAILLFMLFNITRTFRMQRQAEELVKQTNVELAAISEENIRRNWLLTGSTRLSDRMQGEHNLADLSVNIVKTIAEYLNARLGAVYIYNRDVNELVLTGTYAYDFDSVKNRSIRPGEGLVGQAALDKSIVVYNDIPEGYIRIQSGLGAGKPANILVAPVYSGNKIQAVIELGFSEQITQQYLDYIQLVNENIAVSIQSAKARDIMQQQAEELQTQQEELQQTNEELINQTNLLQASEEELRVQQEELQQTNVELEEKATLLAEQNKNVEDAREAIVQKAQELEQTNKYKSEFLANMSHELRTPLNSILILAKLLSENKNKTLGETDIKYASVIYNSGNDLLTLINDILDLSKIESGKLDMNFEAVDPGDIAEDMENMFRHMAVNKQIEFTISVSDSGLPAEIYTDKQRLEQVLRNLLSNAFKFTPQHGRISLAFSNDRGRLRMAVKDTGIGIPAEKQRLIFEAFQQADGTTSRKYGGTGLGLSISRELAMLLGGEITIESTPNVGSTFSLIIPFEFAVPFNPTTHGQPEEVIAVPLAIPEPVKEPADAGRSNTILIVEDDLNFAAILKDYAEEKGFGVLLAHDGEAGLKLAAQHRPMAILLDIMLPVLDGWQVLKRLKNDPELSQIPVHIMSANEQNGSVAENRGALSFLEKPVSANKLESLFTSIGTLLGKQNNLTGKKILVVEDNETESDQLKSILGEESIRVTQAYTGGEALKMLEQEAFDCVILDLKLPDMDGVEVLKQIKMKNELRSLPVIINTAMDIPAHTQAEIIKYSNAFVIKNKRSNERIMDEIMLFMSKIRETRPAKNKPAAEPVSSVSIEKALKDKHVLLVDDDMRNIFALSSILQQYDLKVEIANNGVEALAKLREKSDFDLVLMDIMMPEMDGYEATRQIRLMPQYKNIPVIALTAKAMKNDKEKCLEAGASDYMAKPVDPTKLVSLMRVWLSR